MEDEAPLGEVLPTSPRLDELPKALEINRITVNTSIYHQTVGEEPKLVPCNYDRELESDEQPYDRILKVGEEWQQLVPDSNWVKQAGMLQVLNREGVFNLIQPTDEQKAESAKKILQIAYEGSEDGWLVLPREPHIGIPSDISKLRIRCQSGTAKYRVVIYPI